jgi:hypothetical protein
MAKLDWFKSSKVNAWCMLEEMVVVPRFANNSKNETSCGCRSLRFLMLITKLYGTEK